MEQVIFLGWNLAVETQNWCPEFLKMGVNSVAVAPHGPILCEDEATPSRKPFKYLPRPFRALPDQKIIKNNENLKNQKNIYFHINSRSTALAAAIFILTWQGSSSGTGPDCSLPAVNLKVAPMPPTLGNWLTPGNRKNMRNHWFSWFSTFFVFLNL